MVQSGLQQSGIHVLYIQQACQTGTSFVVKRTGCQGLCCHTALYLAIQQGSLCEWLLEGKHGLYLQSEYPSIYVYDDPLVEEKHCQPQGIRIFVHIL